jgi:hypothetical protein
VTRADAPKVDSDEDFWRDAPIVTPVAPETPPCTSASIRRPSSSSGPAARGTSPGWRRCSGPTRRAAARARAAPKDERKPRSGSPSCVSPRWALTDRSPEQQLSRRRRACRLVRRRGQDWLDRMLSYSTTCLHDPRPRRFPGSSERGRISRRSRTRPGSMPSAPSASSQRAAIPTSPALQRGRIGCVRAGAAAPGRGLTRIIHERER